MVYGIDKAVEALLRGQESANRLKTVLENPRTSSVPTEPLFDTVLDSFSVALSFVTKITFSNRESSQNMATPVARKSPKIKSYGEEGLEHYRDDSPTPLRNDGFVWRKYGQKKIKTSSYQRCYYRCAYAKDQNCNATKRVQKIQDSPSVYRTTYVGKHMCQVSAFSAQPSGNETYGSKMIQFEKFIGAAMSESVMPPLVSVDHQETIESKLVDDIINQECDNNEFVPVVGDDEIWGSQFAPEIMSFLDDIPDFDFNLFQF